MSARYQKLLSLIMEHSRANIGYDQGQRWTWLDKANKRIVPNKEGDCSAVTIGLIWLAGYPVPDANIGGTLTCYTGNAYDLLHTRAGLTATPVKGWTVAQINKASKPGCALLKDGHIMIKAPVAGDMWYSMNHDERNGAAGGQAGDQKGDESTIRSLWMPSIGWQYIFTPTDIDSGDDTTGSGDTTTNPNDDTVDAPVLTQLATPKPPAGLTSGVTMIANSVTNVRTGPSTDYTVVGTLPPNTVVTGTMVSGWIHITQAPSQYIGSYVSGTVLAGITTTPAAETTPTAPSTSGQTPPVTTTTTTIPPVPITPPARQTLFGLTSPVIMRLQTRLNELVEAYQVVNGQLDQSTILGWQYYYKTPPTGELSYPSQLIQAIQKDVNKYRSSHLASTTQATNSIMDDWVKVREDGIWDYATALAVTDFLMYRDGMHL